ncbi:hypothetical protein G1ANC_00253 [Candidatus Nanosynsacchari sp. TM7_ANC_38.39_G1_1]|nr:hypothetical protein G1ANC_00253 [Candidatus Nanosynsacchari sp. TM7_ANC_38.39_G1_1]
MREKAYSQRRVIRYGETSSVPLDRERERRELGRRATLASKIAQRITAPFRYYRPGDPITRFTIAEEGAWFDLSATNGAIPNVTGNIPLRVFGDVTTPFTPKESERILAYMIAARKNRTEKEASEKKNLTSTFRLDHSLITMKRRRESPESARQ